MIREAIYYEVICDHCGERLSLDGVTSWETYEDALEAASYCDWQEMQDDRIYCPSCIDKGEMLFTDDNNEDNYD